MKITKLKVNGLKQELPLVTDKTNPLLELKTSILVTGAMRGAEKTPEVNIEDNDLIELVYEDNTSWLCAPNTLEEIYPGSITQNRAGSAVFELPAELENPEAERGIIGTVALKILNVFSRKAAQHVILVLAEDLEEKQIGNFKGLVRINRFFELQKFEKDDTVDVNVPVLLFIHGTNSSTQGSFSELLGTDLWNHILQSYDKRNILALQHATLTQSPLQNALDLIKQLPSNVNLHIITHSRGGLVGEVLCRFSGSAGTGFTDKDIAFFNDEKREQDVNCIHELRQLFPAKNIQVKKFIRVACPAGGTTILSKRLDHFFNISLNLIGAATGILANPVYTATKNLLTAIVDQKNDHKVLPGLEAMRPDSPFITVLNNQSSTISISEPVVAISGNCKAKLNLKALVIIASKLFFFEDNDLVVNTKSMYNGSKRKDKLHFFFDEGSDVDHFRYFKNKKTNAAILLALKSTGGAGIDGFTSHFRGQIGEAERNAILGLDGGQYLTGEPSGKKPIVILLPGIMGSNLVINNDLVWVNYLRFLTGELKRLAITESGIKAPSIIKTSYRALGEFLSSEYDVVTFSFDWRLPLEKMTDIFNDRIKALLKFNQPVKIVAHSMGGVLVRDFMVFHPVTWKELNQSAGFRLLLLGSPLQGSFRIVNVLFGEDDIISKLSKLDIAHTKRELIKMFSCYPGLLCLLPFTTDAGNDFSKKPVWDKMAKAAFGDPEWPIPDENNLAEFGEYRDKIIAASPGIDYSNAVYIAGRDKHTPCSYRIDTTSSGDELVFLSTSEGDQSVTWDSGIPAKMVDAKSVYYVNFSHGALACTRSLFSGIKEILANGNTHVFTRNRPVVRGERKIFRKPETSDFDLTPQGVENTLLGISGEETIPSSELPIQVRVSHGDLKYASYPLLAGHFKNDSILYGESRVDKLLNGLLEERHKLGLYPGDIGTYEILLTYAGEYPGAIIVGLGEPDKLTAFELTRTAEQALCKYLLILNGREKLKTPFVFKTPLGISALIIGCGYGGLSIESSISAILQAVINANIKLKNLYKDKARLIELVEFVELYENRAVNGFYSVRRLGKENGGTLNITPENTKPRSLLGARKQVSVDDSVDWWNRITIIPYRNKQDQVKGLRFSISTGAAREDLKTVFTTGGIVDNLVDSISIDHNWTTEKARAVFELLIPNDFKSRLKKHGNITWVLDEHTAAYPWELLQDNGSDVKPLCINAGMIRQLSIDDARANIEPVASNTALVIGDPDLQGFLVQLPGALEEAKAVVELLKLHNYDTKVLIRESQDTIVPALMSGYKIIHLAGHGLFDPDTNADYPNETGMVIGKNNYLTTAQINQMSITPELVFVNCCFLGKMDGVAEEFYRSRFKLAANIGTQLIKNGVKAVVVAGWAVDDAAALTFARKFYENMFSGKTFGEAVRLARETVYLNHPHNNTWGAYQCYGDPFYKLRETRWGKAEKNYIIAAQAEMDLANLLSDLDTGEVKTETALEKLKVISTEVDKCGIRTPLITQREGMIFKELNSYESAIEKFGQLLSSNNGDYSFIAVEQYCNLRVKVLIQKFDKNSSDTTLVTQFEKVIADLQALILLSPSVERYSLMGSAWKRKIRLHAGSDKMIARQCIREACINYYLAFMQGRKEEGVYAYTNWFALENILVLEGNQQWGIEVIDAYKKPLYELPLINEITETFELMQSHHLKRQDVEGYWEKIKIPNMRLCTWMLTATVEKEQTAMPNLVDVENSYLDVWKMVGTIDQKKSEIQHLDLLMEALACVKPEHYMYDGLKKLKKQLEDAINN